MQVLTLAAYFNFTAQRVFSADRHVEGSVATGGLRTSRGFSLLLFSLLLFQEGERF